MNEVWTIAIFSMVLILSGCGLTSKQRAGVLEFAEASEGIGVFTATTLSEMREETIEMNAKNIAIRTSMKKCKSSEKGCTEPFNDENLYESFSPVNVTTRIAAAIALAQYGQLLKALVEDTQEAEIKQASDKLAGSLGNVAAKAGNDLNAQQLESLGIAVQIIGKAVVEHKKEKAVKEIVANTTGAVDTLCTLLITDFDPEGDGLAGGYDNTIQTLRGSVRKGLRNERNMQNLVFITEAYRVEYDNHTKLDTVVIEAGNTLKKLVEANDNLAEVLKDKRVEISDIKVLVQQFQQLRNAVILIGNKS